MSDRKTNLSGLRDMYWFVRLAIITGLFSTAITAEKLPHMIFYPAGDAPLAQKYAEYNQRWFDDKLPAESVEISWGESTGTYYTNYEDEGFHARISIIRKVEGYDNRVCMEVLHEMVHMKLALTDKDLFADDSGPAHDEKFQHEMLNLAEKGAFSECW